MYDKYKMFRQILSHPEDYKCSKIHKRVIAVNLTFRPFLIGRYYADFSSIFLEFDHGPQCRLNIPMLK